MKTTPNPNATKKRRGELVGPPPPLLPLAGELVAAGGVDGALVDAVAVVELMFPAAFRSADIEVAGSVSVDW